MKKRYTQRGFGIVEFKDGNGVECSLQKSSSAMKSMIWLGVNDSNPQIMSSDAIRLGLKKREGGEADNGWTKFEVPKEVYFNDRMHLDQEQVKKLIPYLIGFALTGELKASRKLKF